MPEQETVFYQDKNVKITNARVILGARTFAMSNISSVATSVIPADRTLGIIIALAGILVSGCCGLIFLATLIQFMVPSPSNVSFPVLTGLSIDTTTPIGVPLVIGLFVLFGLLFLVLGIFLAIRAKPTYVVRIDSASGEPGTLASKNYPYINRIVSAINQAMIQRG